jgi:hypothetical protein
LDKQIGAVDGKVILAHPIHHHMLSGELLSFRPPFFLYTRNYGLKNKKLAIIHF